MIKNFKKFIRGLAVLRVRQRYNIPLPTDGDGEDQAIVSANTPVEDVISSFCVFSGDISNLENFESDVNEELKNLSEELNMLRSLVNSVVDDYQDSPHDNIKYNYTMKCHDENNMRVHRLLMSRLVRMPSIRSIGLDALVIRHCVEAAWMSRNKLLTATPDARERQKTRSKAQAEKLKLARMRRRMSRAGDSHSTSTSNSETPFSQHSNNSFDVIVNDAVSALQSETGSQ